MRSTIFWLASLLLFTWAYPDYAALAPWGESVLRSQIAGFSNGITYNEGYTKQLSLPWLLLLLFISALSFTLALLLIVSIRQKKHLGNRLSLSKQRYERLVQENIGLMCTHDLHGKILFVNQSASNAFGYPIDVLLTMNVRDLLHPDILRQNIKPSFEDYLHEIRKEKGKKGFMKVFTGTGQSKILYYKCILVEEEQGEHILALLQDITDLWTAERQRNEVQERTERIIAAVPDIIASIDQDGNIRYINHANPGTVPFTFVGKNIREIFNGTVLEERIADINDAFEENRIVESTFEFRNCTFQSRTIPFNISGIPEAIVILTDITEKLKQEQKLEENLQRFKALSETIPGVIYRVDLSEHEDGSLVFVSQGIQELSGYPVTDFVSGSIKWYDLILEEDLPKVKNAIRLRCDVPFYSLEYRIKDKNGSTRWVLNQGYTTCQGTLRVWSDGVILDITSSKQNTIALANRERELNHLVSSLDDVVFEIDTRGRIVNYFAKNWRMLILPPKVFLNKKIAEALEYIPEYASLFTRAYKNAITNNHAEEFEYSLIINDEKHWYRARVTPLKDTGAATILISEITLRKLAEEQLIKSEERLRFILSSGSNILYARNIKYLLTYISPTIRKVMGYEPETLLSNTSLWDSLVHPDDLIRVQGRISELFEKKQLTQEYRLKHADGRWVWIRDQQVVSVDHSGAPLEIIGTYIDITDRKVSELTIQLINNELEEFKYAINASSIVSITDDQGRIKYANEKFQRVSQYQSHELIGKKHHLINSGFHSKEFWSDMWRTIRNGDVWRADVRNKAKDGTYYWVDTSIIPIKDLSGRIVEYISIRNEITKKKENEDQLQLLSLVASQTSNYVIITSKEGGIIWVNESFEKFTGYHLHEIKGRKPGSFLQGPESSLETSEYMSEMIREEKSFSCEIINYTKKGEKYWVQINSQSIRDESGMVVKFFAIMRNVTEQKWLIENLKTAREKAEESNRLKSAFLANISHEIRTPMNAIMGFSELLDRPAIREEKRMEFTRLIRQRSQDLLNTLNNILDVSKIESGQISAVNVAGNIQELFDKLLHTYTEEIAHLRHKNIVIRMRNELQDEQNVVMADFLRLYQILNNLLNNAIKFTMDGFVEFNCTFRDKNTLLFSVCDSGIGIDPEKIETIFEPFQQATETTHQYYGGTGLGLTISKGLLDLWGGEIWVESQPGKGSAFYFTMPYLPQKSKRIPEIPSLRYDLSGLNILLVEDDKDNATYVKEILAETSCNVLHADTAKSALELFHQHAPDMILLDIGLPDIDGLQVMRTIKSKNPKAIIIALTAFTTIDSCNDSISSGCEALLTKPIRQNQLLQTLTKYYGQQNSEATSAPHDRNSNLERT